MAISVVHRTYETLEDLRDFLHDLPKGSTTDVLFSDLETGNFETAVIDNGLYEFHVTYTGPKTEQGESDFH